MNKALFASLLVLALVSPSLSAAQTGKLAVLPTGSMAPTIPATGATINYETRPFSAVKVGDIILFRRAGQAIGQDGKCYEFGVVVHRVTQIISFANGEVALRTKGDANKRGDAGYVCAGDYIGVMTGIAR